MFLVYINSTSEAQIPDGSIAPDFTTTDVNGNAHNLYEILDSGYTVILNISATWNNVCWNYHNSGALEDVWQLHGPNGDNTTRVLFVEGDIISDFYTDFAPDWISIVNYPMIDDSAIADLYEVLFYKPNVFKICPDKIVTEIGWVQASQIINQLPNCGTELLSTNAAPFQYTGNKMDCDSIYPSFTFHNLGTDTLTSSEMQLLINDSLFQSINWTGSLAYLNTDEVFFDAISLDPNNIVDKIDNIAFKINTLNNTLNTDTVNNLSEEINIANSTTVEEAKLILEIETDGFPNETYWEFRDDLGNILYNGMNTDLEIEDAGTGASSSSNNQLNTNSMYVDSIFLETEGCYYFHIIDRYGDGICCNYGEGGFSLRDADFNILAEGSEFGTESITVLHYTEPISFADCMPNLEIDGYTVLAESDCYQAEFYSWDFGDGSTSTDQYPSMHTYAENGTYTLSLIVSNALGDADTFLLDLTINVLDVKSFENDFVTIAPNPSNKIVTVYLKDLNLTVNSINLINLNGQLIQSKKEINPENSFHVDGLSSGIYYIILKTGKGVISKKIQIKS